jgi:hypothetical protein
MIRARVSLFKNSNYIKEFRKKKEFEERKKLVSKKKGKQVPSHLPTKIKQKKKKKVFFLNFFSSPDLYNWSSFVGCDTSSHCFGVNTIKELLPIK